NRNWWPCFGLFLLSVLVAIAGLLGCGIGVLFTLPIAVAAIVYAYEGLFGQRTQAVMPAPTPPPPPSQPSTGGAAMPEAPEKKVDAVPPPQPADTGSEIPSHPSPTLPASQQPAENPSRAPQPPT